MDRHSFVQWYFTFTFTNKGANQDPLMSLYSLDEYDQLNSFYQHNGIIVAVYTIYIMSVHL